MRNKLGERYISSCKMLITFLLILNLRAEKQMNRAYLNYEVLYLICKCLVNKYPGVC